MYFWFLSKQGINNSILVRWVALLALLISMQYTSAATADIYLKPAVIGTIDSLEYDRTHQQLHIHGWVWDSVSAQPAAKLRVAIRDEIHEIDSPVQIARQDVQAVQGIPLVETGFSATAALHQPVLGGSYPVEITAIFTDGRAFRLPAGDNRTPLLQVKEVVGAIDSLMYEDFHHQLEIHGWVWDSVTAQPAVKLRVSIQGQNYELKPLTAVVRKDVQVALDIPLQASGFSATVVLHKALSSGVHPVAITAFLADGRSFEVLSGHEDTPLVQVDKPRSRHWVLLVLVLVWIALAYVPRLRLWGDLAGDCVQCHPRCISIAIGVTFVLLVAMGITGSSWQLLSRFCPSENQPLGTRSIWVVSLSAYAHGQCTHDLPQYCTPVAGPGIAAFHPNNDANPHTFAYAYTSVSILRDTCIPKPNAITYFRRLTSRPPIWRTLRGSLIGGFLIFQDLSNSDGLQAQPGVYLF